MTLNEYQIAAFRTCPQLGERYLPIFAAQGELTLYNELSMKLNLNHMVSGMNSELSELKDAEKAGDKVNIAEEMADIMWYVGGYCTFREIKLQDALIVRRGTVQSLAWHIQELTDLVKKFTAYNKPISNEDELYHITSITFWIVNTLGEQIFNVAIKNNIDKLRVRYPEKFSDEAAINRNLDAERKELEK